VCANKARENSKQHRVRNAIRPHPRVRDLGSRGRRMQSADAVSTGALCARPAQPSHGADAGTPSGRGCHLQGRSAPSSLDHSVKDWASQMPSQTHLPLTTRSPRTHRWVPSYSPTVSCLRLPCGRLEPAAPLMFAIDVLKRAWVPQLQRVEASRSALEVRYRAAVWALVISW
jgi:hypothetical protein